MFILLIIIILSTVIYIHDRIVSEVALIEATYDHSKMNPYHYFDTLDVFLR